MEYRYLRTYCIKLFRLEVVFSVTRVFVVVRKYIVLIKVRTLVSGSWSCIVLEWEGRAWFISIVVSIMTFSVRQCYYIELIMYKLAMVLALKVRLVVCSMFSRTSRTKMNKIEGPTSAF